MGQQIYNWFNMMSHFILSLIMVVILPSFVMTVKQGSNQTGLMKIDGNVTFPYSLIIGEAKSLNFNYSFPFMNESSHLSLLQGWIIEASLDDKKTIRFQGKRTFYIEKQEPTGDISLSFEAKLPGRNILYFHGRSLVNDSLKILVDYGKVAFKLFSERKEQRIDTVFNVGVILLIVIANIGMGAKIDLSVVKGELKRPIAPVIGLSSQFIIMPLISFAVAYSMNLDPGIALGFFALGCSPGGSASNMYTFLLEGNVSLSVTMTLISTLASLGLMPLWLFTLGHFIFHEGDIKIPYQNIIFSLIGVVIPVVVGILLQRKFPKVANIFIKAIKYIMVLFVLFVFTVGVYANLYIFHLLSAEVLLGAAILPYVGFALGGLVAFAFRQDKANIITIAVETGIQNTGIPIILLRMSLEGPDRDTSIIAPVVCAIFTPIPLVAAIIYIRVKRCRQKKEMVQELAEVGSLDAGDKVTTQKMLKESGEPNDFE